jgi:hypothetical protein
VPLDPAALKTRLGIDPSDTTQDAAIAAIAADAQALCEDYCDRKFDLADDSETFFDCWSTLLLRRWPLDPATPPVITSNGTPVGQEWAADTARGILYGWPLGLPVTVAYRGGFEPWPSTLTWAVTTAFDVLWAETPGGGLAPGEAAEGGTVRKYSVVGAYSVETTSGAPGEVGANEGEGWGPLPGPVTRALDSYRRESRLGVG